VIGPVTLITVTGTLTWACAIVSSTATSLIELSSATTFSRAR
jgi:hypothetical protein